MFTYAKAPNFLQSLMASVMRGGKSADPGVPYYTQCGDDWGFTLDSVSTSVSPNPIKKGSTIDFDLVGSFSQPLYVDALHVHVDVNGSPLYDENFRDGNYYDTDYDFKLSWEVPADAPDGEYKIRLVGGRADITVLCVDAGFTF